LQPLLDALNADLESGNGSDAQALPTSGQGLNAKSGLDTATNGPLPSPAGPNPTRASTASSVVPASQPTFAQRTGITSSSPNKPVLGKLTDEVWKSSISQTTSATRAAGEKKSLKAGLTSGVLPSSVPLPVGAIPSLSAVSAELALPVAAQYPQAAAVPILPDSSKSPAAARSLTANIGSDAAGGSYAPGLSSGKSEATILPNFAGAAVQQSSASPISSPDSSNGSGGAIAAPEPRMPFSASTGGLSNGWNVEPAVHTSAFDDPYASTTQQTPGPVPSQPRAADLIAGPEPLNSAAKNKSANPLYAIAPAATRISAEDFAPSAAPQAQAVPSGQSATGSASQEPAENGMPLGTLPRISATASFPVAEQTVATKAENPSQNAAQARAQVIPQQIDTENTSSSTLDPKRVSLSIPSARRNGIEASLQAQKPVVPVAIIGSGRQATGSAQTNTAASPAAPANTQNPTPGASPNAAASRVQPETVSSQNTLSAVNARDESPLTRGGKPGNSTPSVDSGSERRSASTDTQATPPLTAKNIAQPRPALNDRIAQQPVQQPDSQPSNSTVATSPHRAPASGVQAVAHSSPQSNAQPVLDASGIRTGQNAAVSTVNNTNLAAMTRAESREAFAALDAEPPSAPATWVHAGSSQAEAGFNDPNLGWVSVRADQAGGAIHATLVPGSSEAASALSSHLDGLNAYLDSRHSLVQSLTVGEPESRSSAWGTDSGMNQGTQQGMSNGAGPGTGQGAGSGQGQRSDSDSGLPVGPATELPRPPVANSSASAVLASAQYGDFSNGAHISVIA
jgi:hypothetical protein